MQVDDKVKHAYFNLNGVWFKVYGDPGTDQVRYLMKEAAIDLQYLKDQNINNLDTIELHRPPYYTVRSLFGKDEIFIYPKKVEVKEAAVEIRKKRIEKREVRTYLTPAFEVFGNKEGDPDPRARLGYVICAPGTWAGPYTLIETENVVTSWLDKDEVEDFRSANPEVNVDPFHWPNWKAYDWWQEYTEEERQPYRPFEGTLENKNVYNGYPATGIYDGTLNVDLYEIASTFEEYFFYPFAWDNGTWDYIENESYDEGSYGATGEKNFHFSTSADCWNATLPVADSEYYVYCYLVSTRYTGMDGDVWMTINNVEVPDTRHPDNSRVDTYDWLWQYCSTHIMPFSTTPGVDNLEAAWAQMECRALAWYNEGDCQNSEPCPECHVDCETPSYNCNCIDVSEEHPTYCSYGVHGFPQTEDTEASYECIPHTRCVRTDIDFYWNDTSEWGNCKDLERHAYIEFFSSYTSKAGGNRIKCTLTSEQYVDNDFMTCSEEHFIDPAHYVYYKVDNDDDNGWEYLTTCNIVINGQKFPWLDTYEWSRQGPYLYDRDIRGANLRYFELNKSGDRFWVLLAVHHANITGGYNADPNRWVFGIYKSETEDIEWSREIDMVDNGEWYKFQIPDVVDYTGEPVWCEGTFRLFRVTETPDEIKIEQFTEEW